MKEEQLQATVEAQSKSYAAALKQGAEARHSQRKAMNNQSESSQTSSVGRRQIGCFRFLQADGVSDGSL